MRLLGHKKTRLIIALILGVFLCSSVVCVPVLMSNVGKAARQSGHEKWGRIFTVVANRNFGFHHDLSTRVAQSLGKNPTNLTSLYQCPAAYQETHEARLLGVDSTFGRMSISRDSAYFHYNDNEVGVNTQTANDFKLKIGSRLVLKVNASQDAIHDKFKTLIFRVVEIVPDTQLGNFSYPERALPPHNVFCNVDFLNEQLGLDQRRNTLLIPRTESPIAPEMIQECLTLEDLHLEVFSWDENNIVVRSRTEGLPPAFNHMDQTLPTLSGTARMSSKNTHEKQLNVLGISNLLDTAIVLIGKESKSIQLGDALTLTTEKAQSKFKVIHFDTPQNFENYTLLMRNEKSPDAIISINAARALFGTPQIQTHALLASTPNAQTFRCKLSSQKSFFDLGFTLETPMSAGRINAPKHNSFDLCFGALGALWIIAFAFASLAPRNIERFYRIFELMGFAILGIGIAFLFSGSWVPLYFENTPESVGGWIYATLHGFSFIDLLFCIGVPGILLSFWVLGFACMDTQLRTFPRPPLNGIFSRILIFIGFACGATSFHFWDTLPLCSRLFSTLAILILLPFVFHFIATRFQQHPKSLFHYLARPPMALYFFFIILALFCTWKSPLSGYFIQYACPPAPMPHTALPFYQLPPDSAAAFLRHHEGVSYVSYVPNMSGTPGILGVPLATLDREFYGSLDTLAFNRCERHEIPAIVDANILKHNLHLNIGDVIPIVGSDGTPYVLRIIEQYGTARWDRMLLISAENFDRLFPYDGHRYFVATYAQKTEKKCVEDRVSSESDIEFSGYLFNQTINFYAFILGIFLLLYMSTTIVNLSPKKGFSLAIVYVIILTFIAFFHIRP